MNTLAIIAALSIGQLGIVPEKEASPVIRVLVFGAEWCGPCRVLKKEIERELYKPGMGWQRYITVRDVDDGGNDVTYAMKNRNGGYDVPQIVITQDGIVVCRLFDLVSAARLSSVANAVITTAKKQ